MGNRTQRTEDGQTTPYGYAPDSNRLTTIDGQSVPYDATGNILTLAGDTFTYGARNRRQTTERNGTLITEYEYNALGQRTHKSHAGTETHFVHGRNGQLIGEYDDGGQVIREYVYLEGEPLAMIHQGAVYYFHNDQLGSPLKLTDNSQNVAWDGVRAPFGEMSITTNAVENPLRFPGQYFDAETGLHQNWFRDYAPDLGRYIQSDPIGLSGGLNTYVYVGGNPHRYIDPFGLNQMNRSPYAPGGPSAPPTPPSYVGGFVGGAGDFIGNYRDMRGANTIGADKYFHCKANCEAAQRGEGGQDAAQCISDSREFFDQNVKGDPASASAADQLANQHGRRQGAANPSGDCSHMCAPYRPNGLPPQY